MLGFIKSTYALLVLFVQGVAYHTGASYLLLPVVKDVCAMVIIFFCPIFVRPKVIGVADMLSSLFSYCTLHFWYGLCEPNASLKRALSGQTS